MVERYTSLELEIGLQKEGYFMNLAVKSAAWSLILEEVGRRASLAVRPQQHVVVAWRAAYYCT